MEKEMINQPLNDVLETLSPIERKILPSLGAGLKDIEGISQKSGIEVSSVQRALQFLSNKRIVELKTTVKKVLDLDANGLEYKRRGLPERRLLDSVIEKKLSFEEAKKDAELSDKEFMIALGVLKSKALIKVFENTIEMIVSKEEAIKKFAEEKLLEELPLELESLPYEQTELYNKLKSRKNIVYVEEQKTFGFEITDLGKKVIGALSGGGNKQDYIEQLTPEMIRDEKWKGKKFRVYDLTAKGPYTLSGKRQPYSSFLYKVKQELVALGFEESDGPIVEKSFWNCDVLFMPQNHPARGIHDLYFVKAGNSEEGEIQNKKLFLRIKETHENGWKTGSEGWRVRFNEKESRKLILRSQGTAVSARILAKNPKIPGKYFTIARVFRPDIVDSGHLPEFNQMEGIIIDKNLNFSQLLGMLKLFAEKVAGIKEIKFLPAYFPFTEPSVELIGFHPVKKIWMELGGAGIFRPEVTLPLGLEENTKVLAWGLGIDRLFMLKQGMQDIRDIFSQDINLLRTSKINLND
jgi:phenylalanyl-tRNA synthetase alpha chain